MRKVSGFTIFVFLITLLLAPMSTWAAPIDEVRQLVKDHYKGELEANITELNSIESIVGQLDPYSTYFTKEEFEKYTDSINNKPTGIGISIEEHEKGIQIVSTFDGAPAKEAGIEPGDIILTVDGNSTERMSVQQASSLITGKAGTKVNIEVLKITGEKQSYILTRKSFQVPVVTNKMLYENVGYVSINSFSEDGASLVRAAKEELERKGATSYILDLRNNGGGYVNTAEELIGLFPNSPHAYMLMLKNQVGLVKSIPQKDVFPKNTKILINGYSASASEMTAAALLDYKSATLYGQTTYGKGTMQSFYPLSDGSYLKLTVAEFAGPKGTVVNKTGVQPQVKTKEGMELEKAHLDTILESYPSYKRMSTLENVTQTKQFTITFSEAVQLNEKEGIELIALGDAKKVPLKVEKKSTNQIKAIPTKLEKGAAYLLLIHPAFHSTKDKQMEQGAYVEVTVQQ
ncbi:MAG: S41 family peptidase [Psychrobacillus sp.]